MSSNEMRPCPFCGRAAARLAIETSIRPYGYIYGDAPGERHCDAVYRCRCGAAMRSHAEVYAGSLFSNEDLVEHAEDMVVVKWNKRWVRKHES